MTALRSSPWSSDRPLDLESSGSPSSSWRHVQPKTAWCDTVRDGAWETVACEAGSHSATLQSTASTIALRCSLKGINPTAVSVKNGATGSTMDTDQSISVAIGLVLLVVLCRKVTMATHRLESGSSLKSSRSIVVDVFRGMTMVLMVFVNYGGGDVAVFQHSVWDGLTMADLVFPWFAWIMGLSLYLSTHSRRELTLGTALDRSVKLFVLGLIVNRSATWSEWRIPGVLQSLGVAYVVVVCLTRLIVRVFPRLTLSSRSAVLAHVAIGLAPLVIANLVLTFALPVPGCPTGYVGPGGDADGGQARNCTGGAHLYIDQLVVGEAHIFQHPTCRQLYHTGPFDPEGLLNWMMVSATTYMGFLAGAFFVSEPTGGATIRRLVASGGALVAVATGVSGVYGIFDRGVLIPVNKNLWSFSYVLVSTGLAHVTCAALLHCEKLSIGSRWIFAVLMRVGRNSLFIYVMHELLQFDVMFGLKPTTPLGPAPPQLVVVVYNVVGVLWWVYVAVWMHERMIFIAV